MIQPVFMYCGTLGLCWSRSVKVELQALNFEVGKSLVEIIKSRQWRVYYNKETDSPASLCLIVSKIMSVPLLKDILQK